MMISKFYFLFCSLSNDLWVADYEQVGAIKAVKGPLKGSSIFFAATI